MPLSKPEPRDHMHSRDIQCRGYRREDGLWDIEARLVDTKTYSFGNVDRGGVRSGEPVHEMWVRLTLDDDLVVREAEAATEAGPYSICGNITGAFRRLRGLAIGPGWRRAVMDRLGGVKGCTHLNDLLIGPVAVTAFQTVTPLREKRAQDAVSGRKPGSWTPATRGDGPPGGVPRILYRGAPP